MKKIFSTALFLLALLINIQAISQVSKKKQNNKGGFLDKYDKKDTIFKFNFDNADTNSATKEPPKTNLSYYLSSEYEQLQAEYEQLDTYRQVYDYNNYSNHDILTYGQYREYFIYFKFILSISLLILFCVTLNKVINNEPNILFKTLKISNNKDVTHTLNSISNGSLRVLLIFSILISFASVYWKYNNSDYTFGIYYLPFVGNILNFVMPLVYCVLTFIVFWGVIYIYNWVKEGYITSTKK